MGRTLMPFCPNQPSGWQKSFCMSTTTTALRAMSTSIDCGSASNRTGLAVMGFRTRLTPYEFTVHALCGEGPNAETFSMDETA